MPLRTLSRRLRAVLCAGLLLALVLAQTLGLVHRVVHAPLVLQGAAGAAHRVAPAPSEAPFAQGVKRGLPALFAGHVFEHGCDLYDQASHADMLGVAPLVAAAVDPRPLAPVRTQPTWQIAAAAAGFLARGPPVVTG